MIPPDVVARARALEKQASQCQRDGRYRDAEAPLFDAIAIWQQFPGPGDIEVSNDEMNLAVSYRRRGEAARAVPILERVIAALRASTDPDAPGLHVMALNNVSAAYREAGRLEDARRTLETVLAMHDAGPPAPTPERARVLDNLSVVLRDLGDARAAENLARRALADWLAMRGPHDADTATSKAAVGAALLAQGRLADARPIIEDAVATAESLGAELCLAAALTLLGVVAARSGDRAHARACFERSLAISLAYFGEDHPDARDARASLAALG